MSFISWIKKFFNNFLAKKEVKVIEEPKEKEQRNSFKKEFNEDRKILEMQDAYENGQIDDRDLSMQELKKLIAKYEKDIKQLNFEISAKRRA